MTTPPVSIKVQLLGPANATTTVERHDFPAEKRYQLLAYLACRGEWVTRERLADLFYPDLPGDTARTNLRRLLRRINELSWLAGLEVERGRLRWAVETDFAEFWQAVDAGDLENALELYRGPLLRDLEGYEDNEFASWLLAERERAHSAWREAVLSLAHARLAAEAAPLYSRLLEQDEFDEEALGLYISALAKSNRQWEALRAYRAFADKLKRELGIEPSSATRQLAKAIERSDAPSALGHSDDPVLITPTQLPLLNPATSFVGRDLELGEVAARLTRHDCHLLTLLGPGGVGKTRLALQSARELAQHFPDGCHFVALDGLSDPEAIPTAIAGAVGMKLQGSDAPLDQIAAYLGGEKRLLVLDNFEHLVESAPMLPTLLGRCPNLRLLATSRVRLELDAEWLLPLGGLALPPAGTNDQDAEQYDAVRLFINRAQRVQPSFRLGPDNVAAVLQICWLVEGYPLGIELAAAWSRSLPVDEIAREVEASLDFLNSSTRGVSERQRSIRATFEYSWRLLAVAEQDALAELSVFRGGFTREAAVVVAGANLALLTALVDKSLLRAGVEGRYDFHPLVQQYAGEKLAGNEQQAHRVRAKHAEHFAAVGEVAERELTGAQQVAWLRRLDNEHDNLRGALRWYQEAGLVEAGLRLAGHLWRFWWLRGHFAEGRDWLATFLAHPDPAASQTRARALKALGNLEGDLGRYASAQKAYEECLAAYRALGDEAGVATALHGLGSVALELGDNKLAAAYYQDSLAIGRRLNDLEQVADSLTNLGIASANRGDRAAAEAAYEEAVRVSRDLGNGFKVALLLNNLGLIAWQNGDLDLATKRLLESLSLNHDVFQPSVTLALSNLGAVTLDKGDVSAALGYARKGLSQRWERNDRWGLAYSLENIADIAAADGDSESAARLWGAAEALRDELGSPLPPSWWPRRERFVALARSSLDPAAFSVAWSEGRRMGLTEAVAYAGQVGL